MKQINFYPPDGNIHYIHNENELSKKLGIEIDYPVRVFNLQGLGVDQVTFINDLAPTFHELSWDYYDVKRDQVLYLIRRFPEQVQRLEQFLPEYYANHSDLDSIEDLLEQLSDDERKDFAQIVPYRRRSISQFVLSRGSKDIWKVERVEMDDFVQVTDAENDYRVYKRVFTPTPEFVTNHIELRKLLVRLAEIVQNVQGDIKKIKMICHQMSLIAMPRKQVSNAPEGIHQDGADYIVSALVVEREGVVGGESRVYGPDKITRYLTHTLEVGEGLFQADSNLSSLWHDVTPVSIDSGKGNGDGVRSIFGFDINIVE